MIIPVGDKTIELNAVDGNIGVLLSGGMDSLLLLTLLCDNFDRQRYVIFTIDKADGSTRWTEKILDYISERFPTNEFYQQIIKGGDQDEKKELGVSGKAGFADVLINYYDNLGILYSGNTMNPPTYFWHNTDAPLRGAAVAAAEKFEKFVTPFAHLDKSYTVKLAHDNLYEHVFKMSHSCTERPRGRCGVCWQCNERQWGFDQNKLMDPGKN